MSSTDTTLLLGQFLARLNPPSEALSLAKRGVLDWLGNVLAGSADHHSIGLADLLRTGGQGAHAVLGCTHKLSLLDAALANGFAGHVLDYDDTRGTTPILAASFALAEHVHANGEAFLAAYVAGIEVFARLVKALPGHHRAGWHPIGTLGTLAAAAACGTLLKLSPGQFAHALDLAATQAAGLNRNRGTTAKPLHAGKAAQNGLLAALLAQTGFGAAPDGIGGAQGFAAVYSDTLDADALLAGLGEDREIGRNGYKPYACGLVFHPIIDAMMRLRTQRGGVFPDKIELRCSEMVTKIGAKTAPQTGHAAKFSAAHIAALAYIDGAVGVAQFTDARTQSADVTALRAKVNEAVDAGLAADQAVAVVTVKGQRHEIRIEHATGSVDNPMSDAALEAKFMANAEPIIGQERTKQATALIWRLDEVKDVRALASLCVD